MENSNEYDDLLVRYLFNEETGEEKVFVENWLKDSEENQRYFNRLKKVWHLIEVKYDLSYLMDAARLEEKWDRFKRGKIEEEAKTPSLKVPEQFGGEYKEVNEPTRKPRIYRLLISVAVAASVLFIIVLGWKFFSGDKEVPPMVQNTVKKSDSLQFAVRHEVNANGKEKRIQLSDSSLIVLANNSQITYMEPFIHKRDILLSGQAYFKVAHDKTKPFTVTSGEISTTALGTEFMVTSFARTSQIIVQLYEGKVVVKAVDKANKRMKGDVFLLPGQEFVYNNQTVAKVKAFTLKKSDTPEQILKQELEHDDPSVPQSISNSWYMFNNQALPQVFDQLSRMYNTEILYNKKDIEKMYFIGKYNSSDSLQIILKRITTLNNLKITNRDNRIFISK